MVIGMSLFTFLHVAISLVGIASGLVVVAGFIAGKRLDQMSIVLLAIGVVATRDVSGDRISRPVRVIA